MKAEEVLDKHIRKVFEPGITDDFNDTIQAMKEYARIQIDKDREESKLLLKQHLQTHVTGYTPCCVEVFENRPINLD